MANPLAIVVVNYASSALLRRFLVSSAEEVRPDHVIVVDNRSSEEELGRVRRITEEFGWELIAVETNAGFGGGMNRGVERALQLGARDVLLLNPDASISGDAVRALQDRAAVEREAVFAPRIVDGRGEVWFDGADVYLSDGRTMSARKRHLRPGEQRWDWLSGACLLVTDTVWRMSGGFDEDYFLYWEDVDFSRRVVSAGGALHVVSAATAVHDEGGTQGRDPHQRAKSEIYYYYNIRNRLLFASKHLDDEGARRWRASAWSSAREVLLRGGRRQFLHPIAPLCAAVAGVRDGRTQSISGIPEDLEKKVAR